MCVLFAAIGGLSAWWLLGRPATGIDDADIFFVYARHFSEGHGFVYNIGGERVEGFTSLLWTLLCSVFFRVTSAVELPLLLFNLTLVTLTIWFCVRQVKRPLLLIGLLASAPAWFIWSQVTLMETGLWGLLLTAAVLCVLARRSGWLALVLSLLVITRPESLLWGSWLLVLFGAVRWIEEGHRAAFKAVMLPLSAFAITVAGLFIFRLSYFGYPFPNTYYAKVSPNLFYNLRVGVLYFFRFLTSNPTVFLVLVFWFWALFSAIRRRSLCERSSLLALCLLPGIGIPVLVGGDHFDGFRFYQPVWPLLCLLAVDQCPSWEERMKPRLRYLMPGTLLVLVLFGWFFFPFGPGMKNEFTIAQTGRDTGETLSSMFRDEAQYPTVACITAGGVKYAYPGRVLDLMGLNATVLAHAPGPRTGVKNHAAFNRDVFYEWYPDIVLCGGSPEFDERVLKGLPREERFKQRYIKLTLVRNGHQMSAYYAHRFLERLQESADK